MSKNLKVKNTIIYLDDSPKSIANDFIKIMDEMIGKYPEDKWWVFENVGLSEKEYMGMRFNHTHVRSALNFYLKETHHD